MPVDAMIRSQPRHFRDRFQDRPALSIMPLIHRVTSSDQGLCCIPKLTQTSETATKIEDPHHKAVCLCVKTPQLRQLANHSEVRCMSTTDSNTYLDA